MAKLEMDQYLFHGIFACSTDPDISKMEAKILRNILHFQMIASREILKTILSEEEYRKIVMKPTTNWNGNSYVSISTHTNKVSLFPGHFSGKINHEYYPAYDLYVNLRPSIILNYKLLKELPICGNPVNNMPGEIQIKDKIPSDYFIGITCPYASSLDSFLDYIWKKFHQKNEYEFLDYDKWYMAAEDDLFKMSEEEFTHKYYDKVILFEEVLKETDSNLKLYYLDGRPVLSSIEKIEQVAKIKEKCL